MGLVAPVAEFLAFEASYRALKGDVAVLGKQASYVTAGFLDSLFSKFDLERPDGLITEVESTTLSSQELHGRDGHKLSFITDCSFLQSLGANSYSAVDISSYEGADIICDLSRPVAPELYSRFDFIFDGSSLDNIFNPAEALMNISRMLRPGGRVVILEHGSMFAGPFTAFSPGWFFDFFAVNKYRDCKVYAGTFSSHKTLRFGPWPLYLYNWFGEKNGITPRIEPGLQVILVVVAEKGEASSDDALPVQFVWRDRAYQDDVFLPSVRTMLASARPSFHADFGGKAIQESPSFVRCLDLGPGAPFE
jgi:hypothetical protein